MSDFQNSINLIITKAKKLSNESGIYKMIDKFGTIMYVGKAKNIAKRVRQYSQIERLPNRLKMMVSLITDIEVLITESEKEALLLEAELIKGLKPKYNIALKDDKTFPYIVIDNKHIFPRIFKYRGVRKTYYSAFGPFINSNILVDIIDNIQKIFKIRTCNDQYFSRRQRPCLLYQISRCSGPCVGKIDQSGYKETVYQAKKFLAGGTADTIKDWTKEMEQASQNLNFEKAGEFRDKIKLLSGLRGQAFYNENSYSDIDIFALFSNQMRTCIQIFSIREGKNIGNSSYIIETIEEEENSFSSFLLNFYEDHPKPPTIAIQSNSEMKKILEELLKINIININNNDSIQKIHKLAQSNAELSLADYIKNENVSIDILAGTKKLFDLKSIPERIEVYDNSHTNGTYAIGAMIVSDGYRFDKKEYKIFKMSSTTNPGDDYGMMREMLSRRLDKLNSANKPDLIIIDGGANHLSIVLDVMKDKDVMGIRVLAIAKGVKRNAGLETLFLDDGQVFHLSHNDKILHYLQRLRDEAHRFAIITHRKLRDKSTLSSSIDHIPGVGPKRKKALLAAFGSSEGIKMASLNDLINTNNIGKKFASSIYNYLHNIKHD